MLCLPEEPGIDITEEGHVRRMHTLMHKLMNLCIRNVTRLHGVCRHLQQQCRACCRIRLRALQGLPGAVAERRRGDAAALAHRAEPMHGPALRTSLHLTLSEPEATASLPCLTLLEAVVHTEKMRVSAPSNQTSSCLFCLLLSVARTLEQNCLCHCLPHCMNEIYAQELNMLLVFARPAARAVGCCLPHFCKPAVLQAGRA